jgi:hypothetical protein
MNIGRPQTSPEFYLVFLNTEALFRNIRPDPCTPKGSLPLSWFLRQQPLRHSWRNMEMPMFKTSQGYLVSVLLPVLKSYDLRTLLSHGEAKGIA